MSGVPGEEAGRAEGAVWVMGPGPGRRGRTGDSLLEYDDGIAVGSVASENEIFEDLADGDGEPVDWRLIERKRRCPGRSGEVLGGPELVLLSRDRMAPRGSRWIGHGQMVKRINV